MKAVYKSRFAWLLGAVVVTAWLSFAPLRASQAQPAQQKKEPQKPGQQAPPKKEDDIGTIRVGTQLVNVLFAVQDKQNRYINDIAQADLAIFEDGKQQEIFTFKKEFDLPLTMAMLVDVSGSEQYTLPLLKDAGARFIDSVIRQNKDTAAVIKFEGEATLMQGLTSNPARVRKALDEIAFTAPPPSGLGGSTPGINPNSRQGGTSMYDAIVAACADLLARQPGRKTIILITDGQDTTSRLKIGDAIDEALRAEVVIYSIGIGDPGYGVNDGGLKKLSEATGGRAVMPRSNRELDQAFAQLEQDLRQQYLLAYEPANETPDGSFRKIEVRVANRKDIRVRHRRGYYAPKG
jgi:VWFA-related protein